MESPTSVANQVDGYYKLLQLTTAADSAAIKKAYKRASLRLHPDKGGNKEDFQALHRAKKVCSTQFLPRCPISLKSYFLSFSLVLQGFA